MKEIILDVSELEAPQPLILAREALEKLQDDEVLVFKHRLKPRHLLNELEQKGFFYIIDLQEENNFIMRIAKVCFKD